MAFFPTHAFPLYVSKLKFTSEQSSAYIPSAPSASSDLAPLYSGWASTVSPERSQLKKRKGGALESTPHHQAHWWPEWEEKGAAQGRSPPRCHRQASASQFPRSGGR